MQVGTLLQSCVSETALEEGPQGKVYCSRQEGTSSSGDGFHWVSSGDCHIKHFKRDKASAPSAWRSCRMERCAPFPANMTSTKNVWRSCGSMVCFRHAAKTFLMGLKSSLNMLTECTLLWPGKDGQRHDVLALTDGFSKEYHGRGCGNLQGPPTPRARGWGCSHLGGAQIVPCATWPEAPPEAFALPDPSGRERDFFLPSGLVIVLGID
jgi:hypothetical protein